MRPTRRFVRALRAFTALMLFTILLAIIPARPASAAFPTSRDIATWRYSWRSIWNKPIGLSATYGTAGAITSSQPQLQNITSGSCANPTKLAGVNGGAGAANASVGSPCFAWVNQNLNLDEDVTYTSVAGASDPLVTVQNALPGSWQSGGRCTAQSNIVGPAGQNPWQLRVQPGFTIPDNSPPNIPNGVSQLIQPDGTIWAGLFACTTSGSGRINWSKWQWAEASFEGTTVSQAAWQADQTITGNGNYGAHAGSSLNGDGAAITATELTGTEPIRHALGINLNVAIMQCDDILTRTNASADTNTGYAGGKVWPATTMDGGSCDPTQVYNSYRGSSGIKMGSLLALPPTYNCAGATWNLTLSNSVKPGQRLCEAMRDYGVYVVDSEPWSSTSLITQAGAAAAFNALAGGQKFAPGAPGQAWFQTGSTPWYNDLAGLLAQLAPVTNNTDTTDTAGGGVGLTCFAPPFISGTDVNGSPPPALNPAGCTNGAVVTTTTAAPTGTCVPVPNATSGATVTASSDAGTPFLPGAVIDGDETGNLARWVSGSGSGQTMNVDLGRLVDATGVKIQWDWWATTGYTLDTSQDGSTWTNRAQVTSFAPVNPGDGSLCKTHTFTATIRYLRLTGMSPLGLVTAGDNRTAISLRELGVIGTTTVTTTTTTIASGTTTLPALVCMPAGRYTAQPGLVSTGSGTALADGDEGTAWFGATIAPQSVVLDLGQAKPIGSVTISWGANRAGRLFVIQTANGSSGPWTTQQVVSGYTSSGATKCWSSKTFTALSARYVRIVVQTLETFAVGPASINEVGIKA